MSDAAAPKSSAPPQASAPAAGAQPAGRIARCFRELAQAGDLGLIAYITAGDPSLEGTEKIVLAAADTGVDVVELGVPFSDPVADGPTIQRAMDRALRAHATLAGVLDLVRRLRTRTQVPLVLFSYFNPILQMGLGKFGAAAAAAGADGVLATDLTPEEAGDYLPVMRAHGLDTVFLAAPTSTDARLEKIAAFSSGFLYLISRTGVTGAREALPEDLPDLARRARRFTRLPLAVGFGISQPAHVAALGGIADAAVVGSALVAEIEKAANAEQAAENVAGHVRLLKQAARHALSRSSENPR